MVGVNAGELIAEAAHAIEMGADAEDIGLTIHPHPTLSETVGFAAEAVGGDDHRPLHAQARRAAWLTPDGSIAPAVGVLQHHDARAAAAAARARSGRSRRDRRPGRDPRRDRPRARRAGHVIRDITVVVRRRARTASGRRGGPRGSTASGRARLRPHVPDAPRRQDRGRLDRPGQDARRPLDGLHAGRRARVQAIHEDPERAWTLTVKGNTVAVVTDGTAVLGLGDIGPEAAMPVMEGKALLFKEFARRRRLPALHRDARTSTRSSRSSRRSSPTFGGINLEDIAAPRCFEIERRLRDRARHPRLPRRPARHGDRRAGRAAERAARGGQARRRTCASS